MGRQLFLGQRENTRFAFGQNMKIFLVLSGVILAVTASPQVRFGDQEEVESCGVIGGVERFEGDAWEHEDGCNNCFCNGRFPSCTKMFCEPGCGVIDGVTRKFGDVWNHTDGCNTCRCFGGQAACTEKFCSGSGIAEGLVRGVKFAALCVDETGTNRVEGESWTHQDGCNTCRCTSTGVAACTKVLCDNLPGAEQESADGRTAVCLTDDGETREEGEEWIHSDGCNECRCLSSGITRCTRQFCKTSSAEDGTCVDESGVNRSEGESWTHRDGCNTCSCTSTGLAVCTLKLCTKPLVCVDHAGTRRAEGDQWIGEDGCNKCRCLKSGSTPCTRLACQNFHLQNLLIAREFADGTDVPQQCTEEGRRNCRQVDINLPFLEDFKSSVNPSRVDRVNLLQGSDVRLTLSSFSTARTGSTSYVFTVDEGGEAIVTVGRNGDSMFGSIKPDEGGVHYFVENCGVNCNVLYERDSGFFNQFVD